jgi:hypothetical protein
MPLTSVRFKFSQRFPIPVDEAFAWAIDYDPADWKRMGLEGKRKIKKLTDDAILLEDTRQTADGPVTKTRLVRIDHERRSLSNTHLGGPTPNSQFWYEFFAEKGGGSRLDFTGMLLLPTKKKLSEAEVAKISEEERRADSKVWRNLARAMEEELRGRP